MYIYIVIEDSGQSFIDVKNIRIYKTIKEANYNAWNILLDNVLKPWNIEFYQNRNDEFAYMCGIPKYIIEEWDLQNNILINKHYIGFNKNNYWFDEQLKKNHDNILDYISECRNKIANYDSIKQFDENP